MAETEVKWQRVVFREKMGAYKVHEGLQRKWELQGGRWPQLKDGELTGGQGLNEEREELGVTEEGEKEVTRVRIKGGFFSQNLWFSNEKEKKMQI